MSQKEALKHNPENRLDKPNNAAEKHAKKGVERTTKRLLGKLRGETEREKLKPKEYKAGSLQAFYLEKSQGLSEKTESFRKTLKEANLKDILSKNNLLSQEEDLITRLQNNSAGRISAYTKAFDGEWYTLDYKQVGGMRHELNIGLADVILDTSVENVLILRDGESQPIKAHRDIVQIGKHKGRVGFVNDETGEYVATFTGDKFKILDNKFKFDEKGKANYLKLYETEKAARDKFAEEFQEITEGSFINTGLDLDTELALGKMSQTSDEYAKERLNKNGADGRKVLEYSKRSCDEFKIPYPIFKEMVLVESHFNPSAQNPKSTAGGLGQFIDGTWNRFIQYANSNNIFHKEWGEKPLTKKHKKNPYCSAFATAWLMSQTKNRFEDLDKKPLHHQGVIYYLAHHEGIAGAKQFLAFIEKMKTDGARDFKDIKDKFSENPEVYGKLLDGRQRNLMHKNPNEQMAVYKLAKKVGFKAAQSDKELMKKVRSNIREFTVQVGSSKLPGVINLKEGETAVFGSSTALHLLGKENVLGIGGANPDLFFKHLKTLWPQIEDKKPSKVILAGMPLNAQVGGNVENWKNKQLSTYMKIAKFLEEKGISVKFATLQPYPSKIEAVKAFNEELRTNSKYSNYVVDTAKEITTANNTWKSGMNQKDNLHMNSRGQRAFLKAIRENS